MAIRLNVKYKYCPECKKAFVKGRLEREKCIFCGARCEVVEVRRSRQYYVGYGVMVLGAVIMIILRWLNVNTLLLWTVGIFFIILGGYLVVAASNRMAMHAAEAVTGEKEG